MYKKLTDNMSSLALRGKVLHKPQPMVNDDVNKQLVDGMVSSNTIRVSKVSIGLRCEENNQFAFFIKCILLWCDLVICSMAINL